MTFYKLSWNSFYKDCLFLAEKILAKKKKIDRIIAISRGGLVPARILSDFLSLPISNIVISSYSNLKQLKEPEIVEVASFSWHNENLLIVDEVSDTGKTFKRALKHFKNKQTGKIYTCSPYIKPKTEHVPDFYIKKINAWIVFPYDLKETYQAVLKMEKRDKNKALEKLKKIGFENWELEKIKNNKK
ncbi:MAG: phosphoribosyltransferase family protein [Patescibacteria group bacterium]|nr:phosphoribosyltransferase family protein [Patescibacteria group bacterium]